VPFVDEAIAPKIERDGLVSGALLVVLLVPIIAFGLVRRHRRPAGQPARPEHEPTARMPYAHHESSQADQMLQYFAAVPAQSTGSGPAASTGAGPVAARSSTYARGGSGFGGTFADASPPPADDSRIGQLARSPRPGITRSTSTRAPKVSGSPPWEPAAKPDTELPWAASPAPLPRRTPTPLAVPTADTADSIWNKPADSQPAPAAEATAADGGDNGAQPSLRPIYVWNPSASTETFPSVPSVPPPTDEGTEQPSAEEPPAEPPPAEPPPAED
jgi:hypothetical protein